ncbi:MAG TPA: YigZ family protein [Xanthomonadales bacterium]|nr:YigZ family protein [Xanthomonadales bacterium]
MSATLTAAAVFEEHIQKSRFLARAWPIDSVESAMSHVAECECEEASHHCYAYRIGQQYRFHDANEPAGTAGRPILQAIDGQGMDRVVVVVTRWFGGIKLGAGGLVRAYGGAAAECLRRAPRRELVAMHGLPVSAAFAFENSLRQIVGECAGLIKDERYDAEGFACVIVLPASDSARCTMRLRDASRGQVIIGDAVDVAS